MRGYDYLEFLGHNAFFANAELRFPLIEAMLTPLGVLGGLRGVLFANIGGASFRGQPFQFMATGTQPYTPIIGYRVVDFFGTLEPVLGPELAIRGLRLVDGRASYGIGLESSLLGFPMHFDWSWKTLFNAGWEDARFALNAFFEDPSGQTLGSTWFRKMRFQFWIGYDF
jgi:outer membrane protein assembly factor BamA